MAKKKKTKRRTDTFSVAEVKKALASPLLLDSDEVRGTITGSIVFLRGPRHIATLDQESKTLKENKHGQERLDTSESRDAWYD